MLNITVPVDLGEGRKYATYPTVCTVCFKKITDSKLWKCSGCKLVLYCCKEHQKSHWSKHKQLCRTVQLMVERTDNIGLFDDYVDEGSIVWYKFRQYLICICENLMNRKLTREERGLFLNPFVCKLCHIHKRDEMVTCSKCCVMSYCSKEHQRKDNDSHSQVCAQLKLSLDFDINCRQEFVIKTSIYDVPHLPTNMKTFVENFIEMKTEPHIEKSCAGCYLSNCLTIPLTLIYAIEKSEICLKKETLIIHVIGSGNFESSAWWCWEYILHYFKNLFSINFLFIGPEGANDFLPPVLTCDSCNSSKHFGFTVYESYYHEFLKNSEVAPDIIVAFNCGFHEFKDLEKHDTWRDSLKVICSNPGTVIIFTSYTENEAIDDMKALKEFANQKHLKMLVECKQNPFRSLIPNYDCLNEEGSVYYNNNFINVVIS